MSVCFSSGSSFTMTGSSALTYSGTLEYSTDNSTWATWDKAAITSGSDNKIYLRGTGNTGFGSWDQAKLIFSSVDGAITISGQLYDLLDYTDPENVTPDTAAFKAFFYGRGAIGYASDLIIGYSTSTASEDEFIRMFSGCTALITPPKLPIATFSSAGYMYMQMFDSCHSLTTLPELPATVLQSRCYREMFNACYEIKLSETFDTSAGYIYSYRIPTIGTGTTATSALDSMFSGTGGTFTGTPTINQTYYTTNQPISPTSSHTVVYHGNGGSLVVGGETQEDPYEFTGDTFPSVTASRTMWNSSKWVDDDGNEVTVTAGNEISEDLEVWAEWTPNPGDNKVTFSSSSSFTLAKTSYLQYNGTLYYSTDGTSYSVWDGSTISSGSDNKIYLIGSENTYVRSSGTQSSGFNLSGSNVSLSGQLLTLLDFDDPENSALSSNAFKLLFYYKTALKSVCNLTIGYSDTYISRSCCTGLFWNCRNLIDTPSLPATRLSSYCYSEMFEDCRSLTTITGLPATTLAGYCYQNMFLGCTSLVTAPTLAASTVAGGCYAAMFSGCTNLLSLPALSATRLQGDCYLWMFNGCTSVKLSYDYDAENGYIIPYRIPTSGTATTAVDAVTNMFTDTGGTWTGTPTLEHTYYLYSYGHTVTYNGTGGTIISGGTIQSDPYVYSGTLYPELTVTKTAYKLSHWIDSDGNTVSATPGTAITSDISLYAQWQDAPVSIEDNKTIYIEIPAMGDLPAIDTSDMGIILNSMSVDGILCSEDICFGEINSTKFEAQFHNIQDITGRKIIVYQRNSDQTINRKIFTGYVVKCKQDKYGYYRTIEAYDIFYKLSQTDMASWYTTWWSSRSSATLKTYRDALVAQGGLTYTDNTLTYFNDSLTIPKPVTLSQVSFTTLLSEICELQALIPHINIDGTLKLINLCVESPSIKNIIDAYESDSAEFEDYSVQKITTVQVYDYNNNKVATASVTNDTGSTYNISNNKLLFNETSSNIQTFANSYITQINKVPSYIPCDVTLIQASYNVYIGDTIRTEYGAHPILQETLSGPTLVNQEFISTGSETLNSVQTNYSSEYDSVVKQISDTNTTISGKVSFSNLYDGVTRIDGANITTGTISADRIDVDTIFGRTINGATFTGSSFETNEYPSLDVKLKIVAGVIEWLNYGTSQATILAMIYNNGTNLKVEGGCEFTNPILSATGTCSGFVRNMFSGSSSSEISSTFRGSAVIVSGKPDGTNVQTMTIPASTIPSTESTQFKLGDSTNYIVFTLYQSTTNSVTTLTLTPISCSSGAVITSIDSLL